MDNKIISETLKQINLNNFYFMESNRQWQPLKINLEPLGNCEMTPVKFLQELAILDNHGRVNHLIENSALFISLTVTNNDSAIGDLVPRTEILISTKGIEFLRSMNEKCYMEKGGHPF